MADGFKLIINSAAKTKKEIEKEVQRIIRKKIENVVDDAIRDAKEMIFGGEKIPPRDNNIRYDKKPQQPSQELSVDELAYPPETPDPSLPITEKIRQMRELGQTFYNGYMLRQCAELTIVRQGEFMQDVTDDFGRSAFCAVERPIYGALSIEQLRTYFTWRTDVRRGIYYKTDKPYVMLYCYELLNKIGVLSSQDAFDKLIGVWENCREFCPYLDTIMPIWLRDFYAFNAIRDDFSEHERLFPTQQTASDKITTELLHKNYCGKLEYLMGCSSYNLKGSIFFSEETSVMFDKVLEKVLSALDVYFTARDISLFELICGRSKKDHSWTPFAGAYVDLDRMDGFRTCRISAAERYCIKRGRPCYEKFEHAPYRSFIGYVLKCTESVLRERTGFRYSIVPNLSIVLDDFLNRDKLYSAAKEAEFSAIVPDAVNSWCDEHGIFPPPKERKKKKKPNYNEETSTTYGYSPAVPQKIEIDVSNLAEIRRASDEIAKKLIIEEYEDALPEEQRNELTHKIEEEVFELRTEQASLEVHSQYDFSSLPDEWRALAESLDTELLMLLKALYDGEAETFCRSIGTLPETAYEVINAAALEHIGDCIVENGNIISDYREDIERILNIINI